VLIVCDALNAEAREMALSLINGNRSEVRDFVKNHETPAKLVLAMVRHLGFLDWVESESDSYGAYVDAVVNLQSLLESVDV
jgi:hypothetical protein